MRNDQPYYYATRAAEERRLAMASADLNARRIHLEMAARYDALVGAKAAIVSEATSEPEQHRLAPSASSAAASASEIVSNLE